MSITSLIHSNTTDGSTVFVDAYNQSSVGSTSGSISHSTEQAKWGISSIKISSIFDQVYFTSIPITGNQFTLDFWHYFTSDTNASLVCLKYDINVYYSSSANELRVIAYGVDSFLVADYSTYITENEWTHIAVTFDDTVATFYINGVAVDTAASPFTSSTSIFSSLYIGAYNSDPKLGYTDEVCFHGDEAIDFSVVGVPTAPYPDPSNDFAGSLQELTGEGFTVGTSYGTFDGNLQELGGKNFIDNGVNTIEYLIHSDTTDGSLDFYDAYGNYNVTSYSATHHSTDKAKWGNSSIRIYETLGNVSTEIPLTTDTFTLDFWANFDYNTTVSSRSGIFNWYNILFFGVISDYLTLSIENTVVGTQVLMSDYIDANTWYHIGITLDSGYATVYLNGVAIISGSSSLRLPDYPATLFRLGHDYGNAYAVMAYYDELCLHIDKAIDFSVYGVPTAPYGNPLPTGSADVTLQELTGDGLAKLILSGNVMADLQELLGDAVGNSIMYLNGAGTLAQLIGSAEPAASFRGKTQELIGDGKIKKRKYTTFNGNLKELFGDALTYPVIFAYGDAKLNELTGTCIAYKVANCVGDGKVKTLIGSCRGLTGNNTISGDLQSLSGKAKGLKEITFSTLVYSRGAVR